MSNYRENEHTVSNKELTLWKALLPVVILMLLLAYNIFYKDGAWLGDYSNQYILLMGGAAAAIVGFLNKTTFNAMIAEIIENLKSVFVPIMILSLIHI